MSLLENIKESEGFRGMPYKDTQGYLTIGYGTKLPLTKHQAELLANDDLEAFKKELHVKLPHLDIPPAAWEIIYEMAYQLGVPRFMGFHNMITALAGNNYKLAADEMLDSKWARQMHEADMRDGRDSENRAERLARKMRSL